MCQQLPCLVSYENGLVNTRFHVRIHPVVAIPQGWYYHVSYLLSKQNNTLIAV